MIVEKFKSIAQTLGHQFDYGPEHWQNLKDIKPDHELDFADRAKYFLLIWKDTDSKFDEYGTKTSIKYDGEFVLVVRSNLGDKDYMFKYETHIKNIEDEVEKVLNQFAICDPITVQLWKTTEVTNEYDTNVDGLKVRFSINVKQY